MSEQPYEPVRILGVDTENVGAPRNDGTPGSALYAVPIKLSRTPSLVWANAFQQVWDRPPSWSNMHRPGIARIVGDTIILDGTTVEEVRDYHASTLAAVVQTLNEADERHQAQQQVDADQNARRRAAHEAKVRDVANDIRFE